MDRTTKTSDALRTYRYLRIGMLGAVVLLGASVVKEGTDSECWETSISAYWYAPAKPVLVGVLIAIGFAMIVIKGRTVYEDTALNIAGMLAPVVALVPTAPPKTNACNVAVPPTDELSAMVENSVWALLAAGLFCLGVGLLLAMAVNRDVTAPVTKVDTGTWVTLVAASVTVGLAIWLNSVWDYQDLTDYAHGWAARLMFGFMFLAAVFAAIEARNLGNRTFMSLYALTALGMLTGAVVLVTDLFGAHEVLALESWEIGWFGFFWAVQTAERWNEAPGNAPETAAVDPNETQLVKV